MTINEGNATAPTRGRNWFLAAAALGLAGTVIHIWAGGPEIMDPLYASSLPIASVAVLDVVWQQVTALLLGGGLVAALAAFRPAWRRPVAWLLGGHYLVVSAIFLVWGAMWFSSPWPMPQWILFAGMAGLMFSGLRFTSRGP
ncbi:MAG TPA: hypothetical protein VL017_04800 [Devosia sp.]|nr:hypothetical protein [Devosia sp.]